MKGRLWLATPTILIAALLGGFYLSRKTSQMPLATSNSQPTPTNPDHRFQYEAKTITVGTSRINVQIADTSEKRQLGLSFRNQLGEEEGMLFLMPQSAIQQFWMKDMRIPLDIIWINNSEVVDTTENIPPPTQTKGIIKRMSPRVVANQVLEVNAGFVKEKGIRVGDSVSGN